MSNNDLREVFENHCSILPFMSWLVFFASNKKFLKNEAIFISNFYTASIFRAVRKPVNNLETKVNDPFNDGNHFFMIFLQVHYWVVAKQHFCCIWDFDIWLFKRFSVNVCTKLSAQWSWVVGNSDKGNSVSKITAACTKLIVALYFLK